MSGPQRQGGTMRLGRKAAVSAAIVIAAMLTGGAATSSAYPANHDAPRVLLKRTSAPTTAECEAEFEIACYTPNQVETAYNMKALYAQGDEGQGQTIVIVDSFGSPTIEKDLKKFDKAFKLPAPPAFQV